MLTVNRLLLHYVKFCAVQALGAVE